VRLHLVEEVILGNGVVGLDRLEHIGHSLVVELL